MSMPVVVTDFDALTQHESVVIFTGVRDDGVDGFVRFGVDNHIAQGIIDIMNDDPEDVRVLVEPWQVLHVTE